jgi:hypothetical protein
MRVTLNKLEQLADRVGTEADDYARDLIADIQDDLENLKRAKARDEGGDPRLTIADVLGLANELEAEGMIQAAKGARTFASVYFLDKQEAAPRN